MSVEHSTDAEEVTLRPGEAAQERAEQPLALVVDDEPLVRRLICSVLSRIGWRTLEAADGPAALLAGADADIDLLVTDYELPGLNGIEVADALRGWMVDLPILVVSGLDTVGPRATSRDYRFLAKPFGPGELSLLVAGLRFGQAAPEERRGPERKLGARDGSAAPHRPGRSRTGERTRTLRCFPRNDPQFEADANRILAECNSMRTREGVLVQVRARIMRLYPRAAVYPRSLMAANGDPDEYWYCYRDGPMFLTPRES